MDGLVRPICTDPKNKLLEHEQALVEARLDYYYEENWTHIIISIMQMKNPLVANAHILSSIST